MPHLHNLRQRVTIIRRGGEVVSKANVASSDTVYVPEATQVGVGDQIRMLDSSRRYEVLRVEAVHLPPRYPRVMLTLKPAS